MTDVEFEGAMSRSGLQLKPETLAELRRVSGIVDLLVDRISRDRPVDAQPARVFNPEQLP